MKLKNSLWLLGLTTILIPQTWAAPPGPGGVHEQQIQMREYYDQEQRLRERRERELQRMKEEGVINEIPEPSGSPLTAF